VVQESNTQLSVAIRTGSEPLLFFYILAEGDIGPVKGWAKS